MGGAGCPASSNPPSAAATPGSASRDHAFPEASHMPTASSRHATTARTDKSGARCGRGAGSFAAGVYRSTGRDGSAVHSDIDPSYILTPGRCSTSDSTNQSVAAK